MNTLVSAVLGLPILGYLISQFLFSRRRNRALIRRCFQGTNVIITGASSGIGRELAIQCARYGARNIVITGRRETELQETKRLCEFEASNNYSIEPGSGVSVRVHIAKMDVSVEKDCKQLIERAVHEFFSNENGRIDHLILNAGVDSVLRFSTVKDLSHHRRVMDVNYFGCVYPTFYALPHMRRQSMDKHGLQGTITVTSSIAGKFGSKFRTGYTASKHALHGFFDSLRIELADEKVPIHVGLVCPGFIATDLHADGRALGGEIVCDLSKFARVDDSVDEMLRAIAMRKFEHVMTFSAWFGVAVKGLSPLFLLDFFRGRVESATRPADEVGAP